MAEPVIMPRQGQSVETCIITEWIKQKGDSVKKGDILFSYETDKASFEAESEFEGTILETFYEEGDEVPVLTNVAVVGKEGESVDEFRPGDAPSESTTEAEIPEEKEPEKQKTASVETVERQQGEKLKISPRAKNMAEDLGVDYNQLAGSGPYGRIIARDIESAAKEKPRMTPLAQEKAQKEQLQTSAQGTAVGGRVGAKDLVPPNQIYGDDFEVKKLSNMRKIIAQKMHESLQNSAQLTHHLSADVRKLMDLRKKVKKGLADGSVTTNITLNDMVCFAVIKALKKHPDANTHFLGDSLRYFSKVHLGFAVDTPRGLMVPTVRNADDLSLSGLSNQLKALADSCKKGSIDPELLNSESASFTVSNLGAYGVEMFTPVINLPQSAILGVNTIIKRPADLGGGVFGFVPYIGLSLTYDHRALDGGPATLLLAEIKKEIESFDVSI